MKTNGEAAHLVHVRWEVVPSEIVHGAFFLLSFQKNGDRGRTQYVCRVFNRG
jgi:hypothetical protein